MSKVGDFKEETDWFVETVESFDENKDKDIEKKLINCLNDFSKEEFVLVMIKTNTSLILCAKHDLVELLDTILNLMTKHDIDILKTLNFHNDYVLRLTNISYTLAYSHESGSSMQRNMSILLAHSIDTKSHKVFNYLIRAMYELNYWVIKSLVFNHIFEHDLSDAINYYLIDKENEIGLEVSLNTLLKIIEMDSYKVMEILLVHEIIGVNNCYGPYKMTPLMYACVYSSVKIVETLLNDVNLIPNKTTYNKSYMYFACFAINHGFHRPSSSINKYLFMLDLPHRPKETMMKIIDMLASHGHHFVSLDHDHPDDQPLYLLCEDKKYLELYVGEHNEIFGKLERDEHLDVLELSRLKCYIKKIIMILAICNALESMEFFLQFLESNRVRNVIPLLAMTTNEVVLTFIETHLCKVNDEPSYEDLFELLLSSECVDLTYVNDKGDNLLAVCCRSNITYLMKIVIDGVNNHDKMKDIVNNQNLRGKTPLYLSCEFKNIEAAELLITSCNPDTMVQDKIGLTEFDMACINGLMTVIPMFLRYNSEIMSYVGAVMHYLRLIPPTHKLRFIDILHDVIHDIDIYLADNDKLLCPPSKKRKLYFLDHESVHIRCSD